MFERLISSAPAAAMARDVGELPSRGEQPSGLISLAQRVRNPRAGQDKKIDKKVKAGGKR